MLPLRPRHSTGPIALGRASAVTAMRAPLARISRPSLPTQHRDSLGPTPRSKVNGQPEAFPRKGVSVERPGDPRGGSEQLTAMVDRSTETGRDTERAHPARATPPSDAGGHLVRLSVRTVTSRIDVTLPDQSTFAEALETVLDLCPQSLRDRAIAHGGWILRTAVGRMPDGESTLAAAGVMDGATLFLVGVDPSAGAAVCDDVAAAVAETVLHDPSGWPPAAGRAVALGAAGLFATVACLALLLAGPPWIPITLVLAGGTVAAQVAAGLLSRTVGDSGAAVVAGLTSVGTGTAAATSATAGQADLLGVGAAQLLLGAIGATVCATAAALIIGRRIVPLVAVITGGLLMCLSLGCAVGFDLPPVGCAAITVGLSMGLMPLVPAVALRSANVELAPIPTTVEDVRADNETIDAATVGRSTRRAVGSVTAMIQGLAWTSMVASAVLAFSGDLTAQLLAGFAAAGVVLRARLFATIGQRLPLLLAGIGSTAALLLAVMTEQVGSANLAWSAPPALMASVGCLWLATRHRRPAPSVTRAAELADLIITMTIMPLVFAVLGVFGFIRGLGG